LARKAVTLGKRVRIVIRSSDPRAARAVREACAAAGRAALAFTGPTELQARAGAQAEIEIFVEADPAQAVRNARATEGSGRLAAAIALSDQASRVTDLGNLAALDLNAPPAALARRIDGIGALGLLEEEVAARRISLVALGLELPEPSAMQGGPARILFVGRPDPYFVAFERASAGATSIQAALTSFAAFDHLHDESFDAVVVNGGGEGSNALTLCSALRHNADHAAVPALFVCPGPDDALAMEAAERGASIVTHAQAPASQALGWLLGDVAAERRRKRAETELRALLAAGAEPRSRLATPLFVERHIETLAARAHAAGRPLAVVAVHLSPAPGASPAHPAVQRRAFADAGDLVARLARSAYTPGLIEDETLVIAMPALDEAEAATAATRIAAVGECTAFATEHGAGPLNFITSLTALAPGESGAGLLARALFGVRKWAANG
jgi:two-component system cell cycle response regulator PopA